jgi:hypothetical protein
MSNERKVRELEVLERFVRELNGYKRWRLATMALCIAVIVVALADIAHNACP